MTRKGKKAAYFALAGMMALLLCGCGKTGGAEETKPELNATDEQQANQPPLPEKLTVNSEGIPLLRVYQLDEEEIKEMDLETSLGVVLCQDLAQNKVRNFRDSRGSEYRYAGLRPDPRFIALALGA